MPDRIVRRSPEDIPKSTPEDRARVLAAMDAMNDSADARVLAAMDAMNDSADIPAGRRVQRDALGNLPHRLVRVKGWPPIHVATLARIWIDTAEQVVGLAATEAGVESLSQQLGVSRDRTVELIGLARGALSASTVEQLSRPVDPHEQGIIATDESCAAPWFPLPCPFCGRISPAAPVAPLPCPFCGRNPRVTERASSPSERSDTGKMVFISCPCGGHSARAHQFGYSLPAAISLWNTRLAPDWMPRRLNSRGPMCDTQTTIVRKFRWTLVGKRFPELYVRSVELDHFNKRVRFFCYEIFHHGTASIHAWLDHGLEDEVLTFTTYDGSGKAIYRYIFEGLRLEGDKSDFDYESSDVSARGISLSFQKSRREDCLEPPPPGSPTSE